MKYNLNVMVGKTANEAIREVFISPESTAYGTYSLDVTDENNCFHILVVEKDGKNWVEFRESNLAPEVEMWSGKGMRPPFIKYESENGNVIGFVEFIAPWATIVIRPTTMWKLVPATFPSNNMFHFEGTWPEGGPEGVLNWVEAPKVQDIKGVDSLC